ncbi:MAG: carbonic anhydrase family protein [Deltaproteobacteria bacterium]|jgi:carbonic anhydrase|nr:carbonic anhydrase family protein [Deltaproteobacteria bacterium]
MCGKIALHLFVLACLVCVPSFAGAAGHWGYTGEFPPENWHKADPSFGLCGNGKNQTPVDLVPQFTTMLPALQIAYPLKAQSFLNNGHTLQAQFPEGNTLRVGQDSFGLIQAHFHTPSENRLHGESFPLEAHFVHQSKDGELAVMAVFFAEGESSSGLDQLWRNMPKKVNETVPLPSGFDPVAILPPDREYIYFNGSLTTPPCSEGVRWYVLRTPLTVGKSQIAAFLEVMGHPNNRPLQPVNARPILQGITAKLFQADNLGKH